MLFENIFVEKSVANLSEVESLLKHLQPQRTLTIDNLDDHFGRAKKPYLQKRKSLNLFIGKKKGQLVKPAPEAYGLAGEPHYYFIHTYNCIYECEYCYLQGYFNSPDIVLFVNHEDIKRAIVETYQKHQGQTVWFHAGEFSDSLALSHITKECEFYFDTFKSLTNAKLELRTKSANISKLKKLSPCNNIITSYSLSPSEQIKNFDHKTATYKQRLQCLATLHQLGHPIAIHLDPIIYADNLIDQYKELIQDLEDCVGVKNLQYISLGVVRFTNDVYKQVQKNYPTSKIHANEFVKSFDGKVRYIKPQRLNIMKTIKALLLNTGIDEHKIYLCME
jgi:spore photoproduct lyase